MKFSRYILTLTGLSLMILAGLVTASMASAAAGTLNDGTLNWLNRPEYASKSAVQVVVFLEDDQESYDVFRSAQTSGLTRAQRIHQVTNRLRSYASPMGQQAADYINANSSTKTTRFWVVPAVTATLTPDQLAHVADMPGVKSIVPNIKIESLVPVEDKAAQPASTAVESHLTLIGAPQAWARGYTGAGRLVCSFDTGVEESHPALVNKWRGQSSSLSAAWMSTIKPDTLPYDHSGHGTHTMGLMVGSSGADTIGVAPGAQWITAGVIDQGKTLSATISDILAAFQWALNPDGDWSTTNDVPDVILNSWGVPGNLFGPCDQTFWQVIDNVEAAGIVTVFAAGNEGPDPQTLRNPANRASSPLNTFSVGAVGSDKVVANFSSRGPAVCGSSSAIKPEVVAPGVSLRSAAIGGGYRLMSGTSMAAPVVAGLVAIARQYDPNASVEDIKWAIIQSAEDLGVPGEDNDYGYGLVNADRMLDYLAQQHVPNLQLSSTRIVGGVAVPDSAAEVLVTIANPLANIDSVNGRLVSPIPTGVSISRGEAGFYFGNGGSIAVSAQPLALSLDSTTYNGQELDFALEMTNGGGEIYDTLHFSITAGLSPTGQEADHNAGSLILTVSDFGQYGFARGSIYNTNGSGLRFNDGRNLLYEAGLILARSSVQVSSSVRDSSGSFQPSDFVPQANLSDMLQDNNLGEHLRARMRDIKAEVSIPVTVNQETIDYKGTENDGIIVFKYWLVNQSLERLTNLNFAFLADFDLPGGEMVGDDLGSQLIYNYSDSGIYVGLRGLQNISGLKSLSNGSGKVGLSNTRQYALADGSTSVDPEVTGDLIAVISTGAMDLEPRDSVEVAFAMVVAESPISLSDRAQRAYELFQVPTDVNDQNLQVPDGYELAQNYPNPFNPSTNIEFSLPSAADITLEIYNTLGQRVKSLASGVMAAGQHRIEWDGTNDRGGEVATGVYFYRLQSGDFSTTKKMMLLR